MPPPLLTKGGPIIAGCVYLLTSYPHVDPPTFQLSCTTTTSPATQVLWSLNGAPVPSSSSSQTVMNYTGSVYSNVLTVTGRVEGVYVCNVTTHRIEVPMNSENIGVDTLIGSPAVGSVMVEGVCMCVYACVCMCL